MASSVVPVECRTSHSSEDPGQRLAMHIFMMTMMMIMVTTMMTVDYIN